MFYSLLYVKIKWWLSWDNLFIFIFFPRFTRVLSSWVSCYWIGNYNWEFVFKMTISDYTLEVAISLEESREDKCQIWGVGGRTGFVMVVLKVCLYQGVLQRLCSPIYLQGSGSMPSQNGTTGNSLQTSQRPEKGSVWLWIKRCDYVAQTCYLDTKSSLPD